MKKQILISAKYPEEKRVAILEDGRLVDFYVEVSGKEHLKGNIYKGVITRVEPSLQAAFVDFGSKKHGFLQFRDVNPQGKEKKEEGGKGTREPLLKGQEIIVQVERDERDTKGANLTNYISLPGRYLVMMPGQSRVGISRKIEGEKDRARLKEVLGTLRLPRNMGFILRTAGMDKKAEDLSSDLKYLTRLWSKIQKEAGKIKAPALIYQEHDIGIRTVRDYLTSDVEEVLVDDKEAVRNIKAFLRQTLPWRKINLKYYKEQRPIFDMYNIEEQIARNDERYVYLPSRGYLVFDKAEALTAIDVNSGRSRKERNIEQTALRTNLEAADEIARQLRLRDIGGLIVIDFIDMESSKNRRQVEARMKTALTDDKAHTEITPISKFGILEMTRERLRTAYSESVHHKCPVCEGAGHIKSEEMLALSAFREIHMKASRGGSSAITCHLPVGSANYLVNKKREDLVRIEKDFTLKIEIVSDPSMLAGHYSVECANGETKEPTSAQQPETKPKAKRSRRRRQPRRFRAHREEMSKKEEVPAEAGQEELPLKEGAQGQPSMNPGPGNGEGTAPVSETPSESNPE